MWHFAKHEEDEFSLIRAQSNGKKEKNKLVEIITSLSGCHFSLTPPQLKPAILRELSKSASS